MANFFLSMHAFEEIALKRGLAEMLKKQEEIFLDMTKEELDALTLSEIKKLEDNPTYSSLFLSLKDLKFIEAKSVIEKIKSRNKTSLDYPKGIFVINIAEADAIKIQNDCGVLCKSDKIFDLAELTLKKNITCEEGKSNHSWEDICNEMQKCPCNFILINDRNLFTNDTKTNRNPKGIRNVINLLDSLLPNSFVDNRFEVVIATEENKGLDKIKHADILSNLSEEFAKIRNYKIHLVLMSYNYETPHYDATHNRRVSTNYGIIQADHKIAAFRTNGESDADQNILYRSLYAEGLEDGSDTPEEDQKLFLRRMSQIYHAIKKEGKPGIIGHSEACDRDPRFLKLFS